MNAVKFAVASSIVSLAFSLPLAAYGQTSNTDDPAPAVGGIAPADGNSPQSGNDIPPVGDKLDDIVVTAQRRGENLQRVPIAVTVATGDQLRAAGVRSISDLALVAPSVQVATGIGGAAITIRGVSGTGSGQDEQANAVYLDGVYQTSALAALAPFNNVERIEVLKGPQGTLFGRNSAGGLINIITRAPQFTPEAQAEIGFGNYQDLRASAFVNVPLTSTLAVSLTGTLDNNYKGWGKNVTTGRDTYEGRRATGRAKVLWNIDDDTSATFAAMVNRTYAPGSQGGGLYPGERTVTGVASQPGFYDVAQNVQKIIGTTEKQYSLTLRHDFGNIVLTSITARDIISGTIDTDVDASSAPIAGVFIKGRQPIWTQEFQLASSSKGPFTWTAGLFYYDNVNHAAVNQQTPAASVFVYSTATVKSYAAYAQTTVKVTDTTRLTVGGRYTYDKHTVVGDAPTPLPKLTSVDKKPTWRFAIDQDLSPTVLVYASYSRGFKSGLFNGTDPTLPPVRPQVVDAYELGVKSEFLDRRLRVNASIFANEIKDLQARAIKPPSLTPVFFNATKASIRGAELEVTALPVTGLTLQGNVSYVPRARYGAGFTTSPFYQVRAAPAGGLIVGTGDASGNRLVQTPKVQGAVSARYALPTQLGGLDLSANYTFNSGFFFEPQNRLRQQRYQLLGSSIGLHPTDNFEVRFQIDNVTNKKHIVYVEPSALGDTYYAAPPRTYGVSLKYTFK